MSIRQKIQELPNFAYGRPLDRLKGLTLKSVLTEAQLAGFRWVRLIHNPGRIKAALRPFTLVAMYHSHGDVITYEIWQTSNYRQYPRGMRFVREYSYQEFQSYKRDWQLESFDPAYNLKQFVAMLDNTDDLGLIEKLRLHNTRGRY